MKICRFDDDRLGLVSGADVIDVSAALEALPPVRWPYPPGDALAAGFAQLAPAIAEAAKRGVRRPLAQVRLRSPVANPGKIIGAPANYMKHVAEVAADRQINQGVVGKTIDELGLFLKAGSSLVGPAEGITAHFPDRRTDFETELVVVIGKRGKDIPRERAFDHILGYCIGLDMSVRGPEDRSLRKSVDSYTVLGPWLVTRDEVDNPDALQLRMRVNGEERQNSSTAQMIFDVAKLIVYASRFYTLEPGDLIYTGTPEGVGPVVPGDRLEATIDKLGTLALQVHARKGDGQ